MPFGLTRRKIIGWGAIATVLKLVFGVWLFGRMGWHLPFSG
tara:strand:+ start:205 stop:327 length:123 start_codon:yes stop_codon:yes gene_type:complete